MPRLATRRRRVTRLELISFHRNVAAAHGNGRQFNRERIVSARIVPRGRYSSEGFASSFQYRPSGDRNILGKSPLPGSAYWSLRGKGANGAYCDCCASWERSRIHR